jgi:hypothetical protein
MTSERVDRPDPSDGKSDASPGGPGTGHSRPTAPANRKESEREAGAPRNTPPDNQFDDVKTSSNE